MSSVLSIGSFGSLQQSPASQNQTSGTGGSVEQTFLNYMKESPAQRMIDAWLKAHNLTEAALEKMPPQQRDAIEKQMANDIKNEMEQKAETKSAESLSALS